MKAAPKSAASKAVEITRAVEACGPEGAVPNPPSQGLPDEVAEAVAVPEPVDVSTSYSSFQSSQSSLGLGLGAAGSAVPVGAAVPVELGGIVAVSELETTGGAPVPVSVPVPVGCTSDVMVVVVAVPETVMTFSVVTVDMAVCVVSLPGCVWVTVTAGRVCVETDDFSTVLVIVSPFTTVVTTSL